MTDEQRIKQLEQQVKDLTAKVDYLAKVIGAAPTDTPRRDVGMGPIINPATSNFV